MIREQKTRVLQAPVDAVSFTQAQDLVMRWGHAHESRYVVLANVHVVVTASTEPDFGAVVAAADMATPDGAPIAWMPQTRALDAGPPRPHQRGDAGCGRCVRLSCRHRFACPCLDARQRPGVAAPLGKRATPPVEALFGDQHAVCAGRSKTIAIKKVAACARLYWAGGRFDYYFTAHSGRPRHHQAAGQSARRHARQLYR